MQEDPIGLRGGVNVYGYAYQNPTEYIDPTGRAALVDAAIVAVVVVLVLMVGPAYLDGQKAANNPPYGVGTDPVFSDPTNPWDTPLLPNNGMFNESASDDECPDLPDELVGDQSDPRAGPNKGGKRHTSGPLRPEFGGTGNFEEDLETLAGPVRPWQPGDAAPPGSLVGENGVFGRPTNSSGGASIDIPAKGGRPHETLHY